MDKGQYKQRLRAFNSTPKYKSELDFLCRLMSPRKGEKILDYGCGQGTAVRYINDNYGDDICFGYDVNNYRDKDDLYLFRSEYFFKFSKVFFLHSIAHVHDINVKLIALKELLLPEAKVYVVTPNGEWVNIMDNQTENYKPDPTVIQHHYLTDIENLFTNAGFKINISGQFGATTDSYKGQYINERLFLEATV